MELADGRLAEGERWRIIILSSGRAADPVPSQLTSHAPVVLTANVLLCVLQDGGRQHASGEHAMEVRHASRTLEGARVHVEVVALEGQLFCWAGTEAEGAGAAQAALGSMHAASATGPASAPPAVTALLGGQGDHPGASFAARAAKRLAVPVVCSWNVGREVAGAEAFALSLMQEALAARRTGKRTAQ